jgi:hypothetical protein
VQMPWHGLLCRVLRGLATGLSLPPLRRQRLWILPLRLCSLLEQLEHGLLLRGAMQSHARGVVDAGPAGTWCCTSSDRGPGPQTHVGILCCTPYNGLSQPGLASTALYSPGSMYSDSHRRGTLPLALTLLCCCSKLGIVFLPSLMFMRIRDGIESIWKQGNSNCIYANSVPRNAHDNRICCLPSICGNNRTIPYGQDRSPTASSILHHGTLIP